MWGPPPSSGQALATVTGPLVKGGFSQQGSRRIWIPTLNMGHSQCQPRCFLGRCRLDSWRMGVSYQERGVRGSNWYTMVSKT